MSSPTHTAAAQLSTALNLTMVLTVVRALLLGRDHVFSPDPMRCKRLSTRQQPNMPEAEPPTALRLSAPESKRSAASPSNFSAASLSRE